MPGYREAPGGDDPMRRSSFDRQVQVIEIEFEFAVQDEREGVLVTQLFTHV